jgi:hypothetical protein
LKKAPEYLLFAVVVAGLLVQSQLNAQGDLVLSPRNANYDIQVSLDPDTKMLEGKEIVRWRNITGVPTQELWFHLYFNGWRNNKSTWFQQAVIRGRTSLEDIRISDWGWCQIESVHLRPGSVDLSDQARFVMRDGNTNDRTVWVVTLPEPVEPGETVELEVTWTTKIPRTFARTGSRGNFFFLAHWFPSLGVYQEDGTWNCHQFQGNTEFFSDYGEYDVSMTVPSGWKLGATGREQSVNDNPDGTSTHRYRQSDVHTFTWTTSPDYREARDLFEFEGLQPVEMRLLYQPEHEAQVGRHFRAGKAALQYYGTWYGEYPYGHVTLIDPAWGARASGMEYPTLFTCGTRYLNPEGSGSPEGVTVHEAGHQFWYGIVGNNEFEDAWLDEGLNTFSTARTMEAAFGESFWVKRFFHGFIPVSVPGIKRNRMIQGNRLDSYRSSARADTHSTPSLRYYPTSASPMSYGKTALILGTLENTVGWEVLQNVLSTFFERWKFRHPGPDDFFDVVEEVVEEDLSGFFDQAHRDSVVFDYAVARATSEKVELAGWDDSKGELAPVAEESEEDGVEYKSQVVIRRLQDGVMPVDVLLEFEDGSVVRDVWDGQHEWKLYEEIRPAKLKHAVVDPDRKLLLDIRYTNNSRVVESESSLASCKWASKWMIWLQDYMQTLSFLM